MGNETSKPTVTIDKKEAEAVLALLQGAIKRNSSEVTSAVFIATEGNQLFFRATNDEIYTKAFTAAKEPNGTLQCAVNGAILFNAIKTFGVGDVLLEESEDHLLIKQKRSRVRIPIYKKDAFPMEQKYQDMTKLELENIKFLSSLKKVSHSCATNAHNIAMTGVLLDIKDGKYNIVSTDSKRLSYVTGATASTSKASIIIPKIAVGELLKIFGTDSEIDIYISMGKDVDDNEYIESLGIVGKGVEFYTKLINAEYPEYEVLLKREEKVKISVNKELLQTKLNQINIVSEKTRFTIKKNELLLESIEGTNGSDASAGVDIVTELEEEFKVCINNRYVMENMIHSSGEYITFIFQPDPTKPFTIENRDFTEIMMPTIG